MNTYVPKVGDKVRATLGESVLIGTVTGVQVVDSYPVNVTLYPSEKSFANATIDIGRNGWLFEQVVSVPTKFGAVIRRADGELFTLIDCNDRYSLPWWNAGSTWAKESDVTEGGFTVLFEGVDE